MKYLLDFIDLQSISNRPKSFIFSVHVFKVLSKIGTKRKSHTKKSTPSHCSMNQISELEVLIYVSTSVIHQNECRHVHWHYITIRNFCTSIAIKYSFANIFMICVVAQFFFSYSFSTKKLCHNRLESIQRQCAMDRVDVPINAIWEGERERAQENHDFVHQHRAQTKCQKTIFEFAARILNYIAHVIIIPLSLDPINALCDFQNDFFSLFSFLQDY